MPLMPDPCGACFAATVAAHSDSSKWQPKPGCPSGGYYHPLPKEKRIEPFRELLHSMGENDKVAVIGHAAFFAAFVNVKMTSCQMLWQDVPPASVAAGS